MKPQLNKKVAVCIFVRVCFLISRCLQTGGLWSAHRLPWSLLSIFWQSYCAFVFVCLIKLLSYMLNENMFNVFLIGK